MDMKKDGAKEIGQHVVDTFSEVPMAQLASCLEEEAPTPKMFCLATLVQSNTDQNENSPSITIKMDDKHKISLKAQEERSLLKALAILNRRDKDESLVKMIRHLKKARSIKMKEIIRLYKENSHFKEEYNISRYENENLMIHLHELKQAHYFEKKEMQLAIDALSKYKNKVACLQNSLRASKQEKEQMKTEKEFAEVKLTESNAMLEKIREENGELNGKLENIINDNEQLQKENAALNEHTILSANESRELINQNAMLRNQISQLRRRLTEGNRNFPRRYGSVETEVPSESSEDTDS